MSLHGRFDRRSLERAKPDALVRLARWLKIPNVEDGDDGALLISAIYARIGPKQTAWPPRHLERRW